MKESPLRMNTNYSIADMEKPIGATLRTVSYSTVRLSMISELYNISYWTASEANIIAKLAWISILTGSSWKYIERRSFA